MAAPGCCRLGGREAGGERWRAQRKSLQIAPPKPIENRTGGRDAGNDGHQASWGAEGDQIMRLSPYMGQLRGEDMLVGGGGGGRGGGDWEASRSGQTTCRPHVKLGSARGESGAERMKSRSQEPPGYPDIWPCRARIPLPALLLAARPLNRLLRPLLAQPRPLPVSALPVLVPVVLSMTPYPRCFCQLHVATINSITAIACEQRSGKALSPPSGTRLPFFLLSLFLQYVYVQVAMPVHTVFSACCFGLLVAAASLQSPYIVLPSQAMSLPL